MPRIRTTDARIALHDEVTEEAGKAAGGNQLVSKTEAKGLEPFVKRADEALRAEGGKGTRVRVDALIDRAERDAVAGWEQFNPPGHGTDSAFLAKDEIAQVRAADPQLGALTDKALLRLGKLPPVDPPADLAAAARDYIAGFDFEDRRFHDGGLPQGSRVDARPGQPGRAAVPQKALDVFDFYYRAEDADWASVSLQRGTIAGQDVWAVYMTTNGDDEYLELLDGNGKALASGHLLAGTDLTWDAWPGRVRLSESLANVGNPRNDEGLSEMDEAIAAGQIPPQGWQGDVTIASGALHYANGELTGVDLPSTLTDVQRDVATAALNLMWEHCFQHRATGSGSLGLGDQGSLVLGEFTRPDDGKTYLVADWNDIDDASYTFYFTPTPAAPVLAISQFNN